MAKKVSKKAAKKAPAKKAAKKTSRKRPASAAAPDAPAAQQPAVIAHAPAPVRPGTPGGALAFAIEAARTCADDHCEDVTVLDVTKLSPMADYIVIASGTSDRQMRSVQRHLEELGDKTGNRAFRGSVDERATWIVVDFVDVVVHLFEPSTRTHYDLEMMWGDAPTVPWQRDDQRPRDRAGLSARRS
ncbi:MAG TPA: ribosome silencing factor [Phycisphaerales bacterium]|nr:ribosome silencing factor [Phycisphaerales bacterium]